MKEIFVSLGLLAAVGLLLFYTMFGGANGGVNNDIKSTDTATHTAISNVNSDLTTLP